MNDNETETESTQSPEYWSKHTPYLTPMNFGLSPGAVQGDKIKSDCTCVIDLTVAPTTHGIPKTECTNIIIPTIIRSR